MVEEIPIRVFTCKIVEIKVGCEWSHEKDTGYSLWLALSGILFLSLYAWILFYKPLGSDILC